MIFFWEKKKNETVKMPTWNKNRNTLWKNSRIGAKESFAQSNDAQSSIVCICAHLRWLNIELKPSTIYRHSVSWDCEKICLNKHFVLRSYHNTLKMCKELITIDGATMEGVSIIFFCESWIILTLYLSGEAVCWTHIWLV